MSGVVLSCWSPFFLAEHVYRYVHVCRCAHLCRGHIRISGIFPYHVLPYLLRHGLSDKTELFFQLAAQPYLVFFACL